MSFAILNVLKKGWKILYSVLKVFYFWQKACRWLKDKFAFCRSSSWKIPIAILIRCHTHISSERKKAVKA